MSRFTVTWIKKRQLTPTVLEIVLSTIDPLASYLPGQYINIEFDQKKYRSYSIAALNQGDGKTLITLIVEVSLKGLAGHFFDIHKPSGQQFDCVGPVGRFNIVESSKKRVFVATGTGLAPIVALINQIKGQNCELIYGARTLESDFHKEYVDVNLPQILCLSQEKDIEGVYCGRVTDYYLEHKDEYQNCQFYICGNPDMVAQMQELLELNGIEKSDIVTEKFLIKP
jgi:all-trans-retinol 13,14-reductase